MLECPKCHYRRQPSDAHVLAGLCPRCGIAYNKYRPAVQATPRVHTNVEKQLAQENSPPLNVTVEPQKSIAARMIEHLLTVPSHVDDIGFWSRAVLAGVFALWGASFILGGIDWESIGGSFLHNVNLPFHEFGHLLFSPLGHFMMILGGSLFQILLPLIFLVAFSFKQHDNFSAAIMLWWCGQNFIDVSPYIKDAPYRALPLILGMGEDAHDWGNLLTLTNSIDSAEALAVTSFLIGSALIITAILWATILLIKIRKQSEEN